MKILDNGKTGDEFRREMTSNLFRWLPETGGANLPALNNLLKPLGIALGDRILEGNFDLGEHMIYYASGMKKTMN